MTDSAYDPAGTPVERHCPNCEKITIHNSHWRCIECFQSNGHPGSTDCTTNTEK